MASIQIPFNNPYCIYKYVDDVEIDYEITTKQFHCSHNTNDAWLVLMVL